MISKFYIYNLYEFKNYNLKIMKNKLWKIKNPDNLKNKVDSFLNEATRIEIKKDEIRINIHKLIWWEINKSLIEIENTDLINGLWFYMDHMKTYLELWNKKIYISNKFDIDIRDIDEKDRYLDTVFKGLDIDYNSENLESLNKLWDNIELIKTGIISHWFFPKMEIKLNSINVE